MKPIVRFAAALTCAVALPLAAQSAPPASVPPPPGLDDPGVNPAAVAAPGSVRAAGARGAGAAASTAPARSASVFPNAALRHDERDLRGEPPPTVDVRKHDGDTIQEYRVAGRVTMIRIIPRHGPVQTFYADPQGRLIPDPREGPVQPVYYTLYTWQH
ncbi:MAG: DUF2782 domain-containing protein [Xanthomonadaceae bacterium]|nr:DUF2782 domain-containing protein [Xanthomonadaceae bacterium]MDE2245460.1 DUF2782 domain-containing protein [Xanthomonadaceae bacterium]